MATAPCSECDEEVEVPGRPRLGQKVTCSHCGAHLEVIMTDPLELELAPEDDDDLWEDDDEELDSEELDDEDTIIVINVADDNEIDEEDDLDDDELDDFEYDDEDDAYDDRWR